MSGPLMDPLPPSNIPSLGQNQAKGHLRKCWSVSPDTLIEKSSTI
jgi:hypothetical protein